MKYIVLLMCLVGWSVARKLPSYIEICKRKNDDIGQCIIKNVEILRPKLQSKQGIPEMGIPSINPLVISSADITLGDFKAIFQDIHLYRLQEFELKKLKFQIKEDIDIDLKIRFPMIPVVAKYIVKGKLLILQLDGNGPANLNITDLVADVHAVGKKVVKHGKEHIHLETIDIKPYVGHLALNLENLFPSNPELTDNANRILNENQAVIVEEFGPIVVDIIKGLINGILKNIFEHYTLDTLFPEN